MAEFMVPEEIRNEILTRLAEDGNIRPGQLPDWEVFLPAWEKKLAKNGEFLPVTEEVIRNHLLGIDPKNRYKTMSIAL